MQGGAAEDDSEESDEDQQPTTKKAKKVKGHGQKKPPGKKYAKKLYIEPEQEEDIIEWLKANPCLYDKKKKGFMDQNKKNALWTSKAESLGLTSQQLTRWFKSTRTSFGKITKQMNKSGSGLPELTDRQMWIYTHFEFLTPHIKRMRGRTLGKVCIIIHIWKMSSKYSTVWVKMSVQGLKLSQMTH